MLKGLAKGELKVGTKEAFLPGFPANSLPSLFFFSLHRSPAPPQTHTHPNSPSSSATPLDFLLLLSNQQQGTPFSLTKPNRGSPLHFLSFSSSSHKETLSPLPPINTTPATELHLSFSFTAASTAPATPPAASSAVTASTGASLRLPASSPANSSLPSSSDAQQQPE